MKVKIFFFCLALIFVQSDYLHAQDISYNYQELFRIGDSKEFDENYSFTSPYFIAVSEEGYIYVSDRRLNELRIFDTDGTFINKIDERGRGPGEFLEISTMYIDPSQNHLIVVDRMSLRVTRFDRNGQYLETHLLPEGPVISPWMGRADNEGNHYLLYRIPVMPNQPRPEEDHLVHTYDSDFSEKTGSLVDISLYGDLSDYFVDSMIGSPNTGQIELTKDGEHIIAAPFIYTDEIFLFEYSGENWQSKHTLKGIILEGEAYRQLDASNTPEYAIRMGTPRGTIAGIVYSASIGFQQINENTLAHYVHLQDEDHENGEIGVSLFNLDTGAFLGYIRIEELSSDYEPIRTGWLIQVKYAQGNKIYFVDNRYGEPHVVVAEIEFEWE